MYTAMVTKWLTGHQPSSMYIAMVTKWLTDHQSEQLFMQSNNSISYRQAHGTKTKWIIIYAMRKFRTLTGVTSYKKKPLRVDVSDK